VQRALGAFAKLCAFVGGEWSAHASHYATIAKHYSIRWRQLAAGGMYGGYNSEYDKNQSFSIKVRWRCFLVLAALETTLLFKSASLPQYNLLWDKILNTKLFDDVIETECTVYQTIARDYGLRNGWPFEGDAASLSAGDFRSVWMGWVVPLCGRDVAAEYYANQLKCRRTALLPNGTCVGCPVTNATGAGARGAAGHCGVLSGRGMGAGGSLWSVLALQRYAGRF